MTLDIVSADSLGILDPPDRAADGLIDPSDDVRGLYTPALLADLVDVPCSAVRHWHRRGILRSVHTAGRIAYFDFQEAVIARRLASLLAAGCTLRTIDRRLADLARQAPHMERPLGDPAVVVSGTRLYLRVGDELAEPGGQLLLDFDVEPTPSESPDAPRILAMAGAASETNRLRETALAAEADGDLALAAECYRSALIADGPSAEGQFALADVLYRMGDLAAARERFYAAIELDEEYVEARVNLGCVLAELGELELATATFEGALRYHAHFADAHFHLGCTLARLERHDEAAEQFRGFLQLAPESPWAEAARSSLRESHPGTR